MSSAAISSGDLVTTGGGELLLVIRGGARPVAVRVHTAEPVVPSAALGKTPVLGGAPLFAELEEARRYEPGALRREAALAAGVFSEVLRARIALDVDGVVEAEHGAKPFVAGTSTVPYAGRVFDRDEVQAAVSSSLDFWLTLGPHGERFQRGLASVLGVRSSILVNSGSSANLVAFAALTSPKLGDRRLTPGDEVITAAAGFPTTVNPILQHGCVPVFVDSDLATGNLDVALLEAARSPRTRAVMAAHTLGNPYDLDTVTAFCAKHGLWLIEDNCDALGSAWRGKPTGSFGDLSTQSFYPPHHLTMGEGGAVNVVKDVALKPLVESFRDWGRDCWCDSGKSNTCGKRFEWELGELPRGYDHKYVYSHLGWNLKPLDLQAAIGVEQLKKLPRFTDARKRNWKRLLDGTRDLAAYFEMPQATPGSDPSWFGFLLTLRDGAPFSRTDAVNFLEARKIQTRMLFGGNLTRQPAYLQLPTGAWRVAGTLERADRLMRDAFFIGVYPGLSDAQLDWMIESLHDLSKGKR